MGDQQLRQLRDDLRAGRNLLGYNAPAGLCRLEDLRMRCIRLGVFVMVLVALTQPSSAQNEQPAKPPAQ
jgi:hypothetical protein